MNILKIKLTVFLFVFSLLFAFCSKDPIEQKPLPGGDPIDVGKPGGGNDNNDKGNNDTNNDPYAKIRIRAEVKVGDVLYDQTRASLSLTTYNSNGEPTLSFISLKPGINEIPLLKSASSYKLNVTKWGTSSGLTLDRADLDRDTVYTFSTERDPKVLVAETNFKLVNGKYQPDFKKSYMYEAAGRLSEIQYIYRQPDGSNLRGIAERLAYQNGMVSSVSHFNERNEKEWSTAFTYDGQQRVSGIIHQQGIETTTGTVSYEGHPSKSIGIQYVITKPGYRYERHRHMTLRDGNVVEDAATFNNYKMEDGMFDHDDQVNPYYFLKLPDLYLTHGSKNNSINEYRYYYQNNYPEAVPYRSEYTYDADGYPKEVIRHYRSFPGGKSQHAYTTKTVFEYR